MRREADVCQLQSSVLRGAAPWVALRVLSRAGGLAHRRRVVGSVSRVERAEIRGWRGRGGGGGGRRRGRRGGFRRGFGRGFGHVGGRNRPISVYLLKGSHKIGFVSSRKFSVVSFQLSGLSLSTSGGHCGSTQVTWLNQRQRRFYFQYSSVSVSIFFSSKMKKAPRRAEPGWRCRDARGGRNRVRAILGRTSSK